MKTIKLGLLTFALFSLYGCSQSEGDIENYISKKYNKDVEVVSIGQVHTGNMGETSARLVDEDGIEFEVFLDGLVFQKITGDNYELNKSIGDFNPETLLTSEDMKLIHANGFDGKVNLVKEKDKAYLEVNLIGEQYPSEELIKPLYEVLSYIENKDIPESLSIEKINYSQNSGELYEYKKVIPRGVEKFHSMILDKFPKSVEELTSMFNSDPSVKANKITSLTPLKNIPNDFRNEYIIFEEVKSGKAQKTIIIEANKEVIYNDKFIENVIFFIDENELNLFINNFNFYIRTITDDLRLISIPIMNKNSLEVKDDLKKALIEERFYEEG